ncbi:hypothetical protein KFU94_22165 [Chloroflexi bacterium TSY]|nr:hypothetical protein [Chloroflexi bacterium TSY]
MTISPEMVEVLKETKAMLSGYERRHFMAQTVKTICEGSPTKAERECSSSRKDTQMRNCLAKRPSA